MFALFFVLRLLTVNLWGLAGRMLDQAEYISISSVTASYGSA
ncbi:hypothetical protein EMIT0P176_500001 [Pseudomonas sp. IT-P176]